MPHGLPAVFQPSREPDFRQDRARRSYLGLLDAATAVFGARGYDAVGTPEIAERAAVSVGTFYRYFDDKHAIYLEVMKRALVEAFRDTLASLGPERLSGRARHETISATVGILFDRVVARPQLNRSFHEMALRDAKVAELWRAFEQVSVARIATLIGAIAARAVVPDPEATAWMIYGSVMQAAYGLAGHFGPPPLSAARARAALTELIERALLGAAR